MLNVVVAWWNSQILIAYPPSITIHPQFSILNASFSIPLPQIYLIKPQFSIFNSSSSIVSQKNGIFDSKSPQKRRLQLFPGLEQTWVYRLVTGQPEVQLRRNHNIPRDKDDSPPPSIRVNSYIYNIWLNTLNVPQYHPPPSNLSAKHFIHSP